MRKKSVGENIIAKNASWSFGKKVPKNFTKHISKSVPFYLEGHEIICDLSDFFLKEKSLCYDIGSSTGILLSKISKRHSNKKLKFIGLDTVSAMIIQAKKECKQSSNNNNKIYFQNKDIKKYSLRKNDLIISYYTMQFIPPRYRQEIINKIYKSLNWGGAFIMFEKLRASDARFQDIFSIVYNDFKLKNGFSSEEIVQKTRSLKGILEPFSTQGNCELLDRAGFKDYMTIFKYVCFSGFLAIK